MSVCYCSSSVHLEVHGAYNLAEGFGKKYSVSFVHRKDLRIISVRRATVALGFSQIVTLCRFDEEEEEEEGCVVLLSIMANGVRDSRFRLTSQLVLLTVSLLLLLSRFPGSGMPLVSMNGRVC
jgi:hypothetical protein